MSQICKNTGDDCSNKHILRYQNLIRYELFGVGRALKDTHFSNWEVVIFICLLHEYLLSTLSTHCGGT